MRIIGAVPKSVGTTDLQQLSEAGYRRPEIFMNAMDLWSQHESRFLSFCGKKGIGMADALKNPGVFKISGDYQVKWFVEGNNQRKGKVVETVSGPNIGLNGLFTVILDTEWFGINEDIMLNDFNTVLHIVDKRAAGTRRWAYDVLLNRNSAAAFVDPTLLTAGSEVSSGYTSFPELSEDAHERRAFGEWHTNWATTQRIKRTISGHARHTKVYLEHNGQYFWETRENLHMLREWARQVEYGLLWGKSTMDANGNCYVQDKTGRDIIAGDGIFAQGDRGLKHTYTHLTKRTLEALAADIQAMRTSEGSLELGVWAGYSALLEFQELMARVFKASPEVLYVRGGGRDGGDKVKTNFTAYQVMDITFHMMHLPALDSVYNATSYNNLGQSILGGSMFFVGLGNTVGGNPNIVPFTVGNENGSRGMVRRVIPGMTGPTLKSGKEDFAASPVDGTQDHILGVSGAAVMNPYGILELRKARRA